MPKHSNQTSIGSCSIEGNHGNIGNRRKQAIMVRKIITATNYTGYWGEDGNHGNKRNHSKESHISNHGNRRYMHAILATDNVCKKND